MNNQSKKILGLFARYLAILLIGTGNLYIIYKILTPITIHTLNTIISIFTKTTLTGNIIQFQTTTIQIIPACVTGSAFYLLLILIMSIADIKPMTRTKAIITAFAMLFALNIIRILVLIPITKTIYFETIHWASWHLLSILLVVGTWFTVIKIYKIKNTPIYSDIKYIKSLMKTKKAKRKKKHN